jgi:hypothetical protein
MRSRHALGLGLALGLVLAVRVPARADELLVGALRDQDGRPVVGARLAARDLAGAVVGRDRSAADGTFALAVPARPATLEIQADDADPRLVAVPPAGPVIVLLNHHRAADAVPSVADVAALPAGELAALASVVPERFTGYGIDDRGLGAGYGAVTIAGLPFYRRDGSDASDLLPDHATGALTVTDPLAAPWYGDRAGGGVLDADLFDRQDAVRATDRDAALAVGTDPTVLLAESWDPDGERQLVAARAGGMLGPLRASFVVLDGSTPEADYAGVGLDLSAATPALDLGAHLALTRDAAVPSSYTFGAPDVGSVGEIDLDAAGRGPAALNVRLRWLDDQDLYYWASEAHDDAALVVGTTRGTAVKTTFALALAYGEDRVNQDGSTGLALLPSLSVVAPLDADWSLHAGLGDATIGTPGTPIARSSLGEAGLTYADHQRLRADLVAYADGDSDPREVVRGYAASLGWEFAPLLSLRGWAASNGELASEFAPTYYGGPLENQTVASDVRRQLLWLTWDAPVRIDLLLRNGAFEGGVRIPLSRRYALAVGSSRRGATRVLSVGLVGR